MNKLSPSIKCKMTKKFQINIASNCYCSKFFLKNKKKTKQNGQIKNRIAENNLKNITIIIIFQ